MACIAGHENSGKAISILIISKSFVEHENSEKKTPKSKRSKRKEVEREHHKTTSVSRKETHWEAPSELLLLFDDKRQS